MVLAPCWRLGANTFPRDEFNMINGLRNMRRACWHVGIGGTGGMSDGLHISSCDTEREMNATVFTTSYNDNLWGSLF